MDIAVGVFLFLLFMACIGFGCCFCCESEMPRPKGPLPQFKGVGVRRSDAFIEEASWIRLLKDGWDDDGAPAISNFTWGCTVDFLKSLDVEFQRLNPGVRLPQPNITPVPNGQIDLYWESETGLLVASAPLK